jgi:phospholipid/cholesterol/gamma-HCH transport system substrate-binding protein/paraquat-inducible protein B
MKADYFKVGLFVIAAVALITAAVVTLGAGLIGREEVLFETYVDESVSGLAVGSPVELRGVRIGQVTHIGFAADMLDAPVNPEDVVPAARYVRIVFAVFPQHLGNLPAHGDIARLTEGIGYGLRVRLSFNIITGQAFLEGTYVDARRYPATEIPWEPEYRYIPSAPSELTTLKDSIDKIFYRMEELDVEGLLGSMEHLFTSLDKAVSDAGIADVSRVLKEALQEIDTKLEALEVGQLSDDTHRVLTSIDQAIADANVPALSDEVQGFFTEMRQTNQKLLYLLADPETEAWQSSVPEAIGRLNRSLARVDQLIASERPQIDLILANLVAVSQNLKDLTETLKQHPSELLRSSAPKPSEALK